MNLLGSRKKFFARRLAAARSQKYRVRGRFLVSKRFKKMARANKGALRQAFELIKANEESFERGNGVRLGEFAVTPIKGANSGKKTPPGTNNKYTLKVTFRGKTFFVKKSRDRIRKEDVGAYIKAQQIVDSFRGKTATGKYRVKVVMPELMAGEFVVTKFIEGERIAQVSELQREKRLEIRDELRAIENEMRKKDLCDINPVNQFFDEKTKTIYLFDITSGDNKISSSEIY